MGLLQRIAGISLGLLLLAAVLVFATVVLGILVAVAVAAWGWMWWRTRSLRTSGRRDAVVVEGEFRDVTPGPRIGPRDGP